VYQGFAPSLFYTDSRPDLESWADLGKMASSWIDTSIGGLGKGVPHVEPLGR
jgi:hypothetical protein